MEVDKHRQIRILRIFRERMSSEFLRGAIIYLTFLTVQTIYD